MMELKKRNKAFVLAATLLLAAGCTGTKMSTRESTEQDEILGHITVDKKIERGAALLPSGKYEVSLFQSEKTESSYFCLVRFDAESGLTMSYGIPTSIENTDSYCAEVKNAEDFSWDITPSGGREVLNIQLIRNGMIYRTSLNLYSGQKNPPVSLSDINAEAILNEIDLIRNIHNFLDISSDTIWPGWNSWRDIDFHVIFPDKSELVISKNTFLPGEYRFIEGENIFGKLIYINKAGLSSNLNELNIIGWHGQPDISGLLITIISESDNDACSAVPESRQVRYSRYLIYIHEAFHCEQNIRRIEAEKKGTMREYYPAAGPEDLDPELLAFIELEGRFLLQAYNEEDDNAAMDPFIQAFIARKNAQNIFLEKGLSYDFRTANEGTAEYASYRSAMPDKSPETEFCLKELTGGIQEDLDNVYSRFSHVPYSYGLFQALLLDRFSKNWKADFLEKNITLSDAAESLLNLSLERFTELSGKMKSGNEFIRIKTENKALFR